ncbi:MULTISPECIES: Uma2 family endonuclease [Streptomyces]|uniref:Uma2 family endonuclease n=1 Tax=Streptomyces tsukubensis (strain DSM 42081 / NBRC 108919 / NRRL 18488 / 9993) TaxID=1114943 RepID=A0A7G3UFD0_STRT9|nr:MULTISPECIES: Uma2 family endonuclease [Streptomyces]MYS68733.1 Uma2 family endonuclease [Streptomyces sp. SID5473]QKM69147.1 Uma2 family endonuclease [Streptomyces tsukubensis NRRL18488]TAI42923.1 Uma2 family endonuclease [Streptomyces tsukubensis]
MTAAMAERVQMSHDEPWDALLETWRGLDVPEGWHAEISEGQIHVVPPPHAQHNRITAKLQRALLTVLPDEWEVFQTLGIQIVASEKLYIPDLVVMPDDVVAAVPANVSTPIDAGEALLVVEVTSPFNAADDRVKKRGAYAQAGIPVYLLVDRFDPHGPTSTLYTDPLNGAYRLARRVPFGEQLQLPEPFDLKIDTSAFPV